LAGLLERLLLGPKVGRRSVEQRVFGDRLAEVLQYGRGFRTYSGAPVDEEHAMRLGAVWACVDLLSEIVATLPVDEYRRAEGGPPTLLAPSRLLSDPSGDGSGFEVWCRQIMDSLLLRGNGFGLIEAVGEDFWPTQISALHPDRVTTAREGTFGPVEWRLDNKPIAQWPAGPLWHMSAYNMPGSPLGRSPIRYAADTVGLGLATRKFGAQWFGDGAHPTAILESEHEISEADAILLKARIAETMYDNRAPLVLGAGTKLNSIQVSPNESQFLETSQANVADVARYFRVPPEMIGGTAADNLTYANQEQRGIAFLTYTLNPWLVRLERALSRLTPRGRFVKFNADALLRTDLKSRYEAHALAVRAGITTQNEVRNIEDMPDHAGEHAAELNWPPFATSEPTEAPVGPTPPA
jgi:HK97 family phage portal protein